ncbi:MAG: DUF3450 family protein [Alphaproteobacteria bacterium]|nr:DUF3450 family protein [Alphaproteobacteria bacterium]
MSKSFKAIRACLIAGAAAIVTAGGAYAQLDEALRVARQSTQEGAQAQEQITQLATAADNAEGQYLAAQEQIESQRIFLEQQRVFLLSQQNELNALRTQLERVGSIEVDLAPMLLDMYVALEEFINEDLPFQMDVRQERLSNIQTALGDANISAAERYRLLLNAYEIEMGYGRSLRAYSEEIEVDGVPQAADVLQIGRVALIREIGGSFDILTQDNREWRPVPGSMAVDVERAFRIAREVTTPEVFTAPLPGPADAR